jgi:hypothetical protein
MQRSEVAAFCFIQPRKCGEHSSFSYMHCTCNFAFSCVREHGVCPLFSLLRMCMQTVLILATSVHKVRQVQMTGSVPAYTSWCHVGLF